MLPCEGMFYLLVFSIVIHSRLAPNHVEMLGGCVSSAPYSLPPLLVESQPQVISHWTNPGTTAPDVSQQLHSSQQQSSSQLTLVVKVVMLHH